MCLFNCQRKNKKIIYANVYRNTINRRRFTDASSPDFSWGRGDVCTQATFIFEKKEERRKRVSSTGLICHVTKDGWPKNTVRLEFFVTYSGCFLNLRFRLFLSLRSIIPQVIDFAPTIRSCELSLDLYERFSFNFIPLVNRCCSSNHHPAYSLVGESHTQSVGIYYTCLKRQRCLTICFKASEKVNIITFRKP